MSLLNFKKFKEDFYGKVTDLSLFDSGNYNLLKVVLDGLKVNYLKNGKFKTTNLTWKYNFYNSLKRIRTKPIDIPIKNRTETLIIDVGRVVEDSKGEKKSIYFENITQYFREKKQEFTYISQVKMPKNIKAELNFQNIVNNLQAWKNDTKLEKQRKNIIKTLNNIKRSNIFNTNEILNIELAFSKFFTQLKAWYLFLKQNNFKKIIFICHYHNEGLIWAAKELNIEIIELQHGIISNADIFYDFPIIFSKIRSRALMPDKILTFGQYWKEILIKGNVYTSSEIDIIGDYVFQENQLKLENEKYISNLKKSNKIILITTQTFMHKYFLQYLRFLNEQIAENKLDYFVLVKNHPAEQKEDYNEIDKLQHVDFIQDNVYSLMHLTDFHISIYSTTLFEALKANVNNFCLDYEEFSDYTNQIIESGVAAKLDTNELPYNIDNKNKKSTEFYSEAIYDNLLC